MSIQKTWELFYIPGYCVEVRALGLSGNGRAWEGFAAGSVSGYFNDYASFAAAVSALDKLNCKGVYITINPVRPEVIARANNRLVGASQKGTLTSEGDIAYRRWLRIDIDPRRPSGISSTQGELNLAIEKARQIVSLNLVDGWGNGIVAASGNGADVLYQIELPNDAASKELVKNTVAYLSERYSDQAVEVDTNGVAANVMVKVYGTVARKGDSTADRPHRRSAIIDMPETLAAINNYLVKPQPKESNQRSFNGDMPTYAQVEEWLSYLPSTFGEGGEGYRQWYSVLMAVHSALGDDGIALCEKYIPGKPNEITQKFGSFNGNGVGVGTLVHMAKQHGWTPQLNKVEYTYHNHDDSSTADLPDDSEPKPSFDIYSYPPEDGGILDAWLELFGDKWLFNASHGTWLYWCGTHWKPDQVGAVRKELQWLIKSINVEATKRYESATSRSELMKAREYVSSTSRTSGRISSVENMAQAQRAIAADMINGGNTLNLRNGVLDLDTFKFSPHDPSHIYTYCLDYDYNPSATCPRFEKFLNEILVHDDGVTPDTELINLVSELMGYTLTNHTGHEVMVWLSGSGGNGKSQLVNVMAKLLGSSLAQPVDFTRLGEPGDYSVSDLPGVRMAMSTESERGQRINEGMVKKVVSGETMRARPIYGKAFELRPVAKIWWAMNDKPIIRDTSGSVWRRLKLIQFLRVFNSDEKDIFLSSKLEAELSGILNLLLESLKRLRKVGRFSKCESSDIAVREYAEESNIVKQWMLERCTQTDEPTTQRKILYDDYAPWANDNGFAVLSSASFGKELCKLAKHGRIGRIHMHALIFSDPIKNL